MGSAVCGDHTVCALGQRKWWSLRLAVGRLSPGVSGGPWTQSCPCLQDINDNVPIFSQLSYTFPVKERDPGKSSLGQAGRGVLEPSVASGHPQGGPEAPEGGESRVPPGGQARGPSELCPLSTGVLVGVVKAWDADQTEANNRISFSLSGGGASNFVIRGSVLESGQAEGHLRLASDVSLNYETQASYNLTVSAENPDPQGAEATAGIFVPVEDVNDEPPTLDAASLRGIRVAENGSQHGLVAEVVARDVDTAAQLEVQLVNVICTKAGVDVGSLCHGWFSVLANGSVLVNQSEAIDYETCDLVTLVVRAYDLTTDPRFQAYSDNGETPGLQGSAGCSVGAVGKSRGQGPARSGFKCWLQPFPAVSRESHDISPSLSSPVCQME